MSEGRRTKSATLSIRISDEASMLIDECNSLCPYHLTISAIVERGIFLAAQEIKAKWGEVALESSP